MMTVRHRFATFGSAALLTCSVSVAAQERPNGATAQPAVAAPATLDALVAEQVREDATNRQVVRDVLDRREVREVARQAGLDLERARQGVATLTSDELREIADQARRVDASLSGGASTLVISTTTIIIILLVVILIIVAVD